MPLARGVHGGYARAEAVDGLRDEALGPGAARRLDLRLPVAASRLALANQALVGLGELRVAEQAARLGQRAAREVERARAFPLLPEHLLDAFDGLADQRHQRVAALSVVDRVAQDLGGLHGPVVAQQLHPGVEGTGNDRRQQAGAGHQVEALGPVVLDGRARRGRSLTAENLGLPRLDRVEGYRHLAARAVQVGLHHLQREAHGDRRVEGVAAFFQDAHARSARQPMGAADDPEGPLDLWPCGESGQGPWLPATSWLPVDRGRYKAAPTTSLQHPGNIRSIT